MKTAKKMISQKIYEGFTRIQNKSSILDKQRFEYGDGQVVNAAELDSIIAIGNNPGINITGLAAVNGVSVPAVSRMIKKLISKELVIKRKEKGNKKVVSLELSEPGNSIYKSHQAHLDKLLESIESKIGSTSIEQIDGLLGIIQAIEDHLDKHIEDEAFNRVKI